VDAAYAVHSRLGSGLTENVYEACLVHELAKRGCSAKRQVRLPVRYDGVTLNAALRLDMVVDERVVAELKAGESILPLHRAQLLTYLKLSGLRSGLLVNSTLPSSVTASGALSCSFPVSWRLGGKK